VFSAAVEAGLFPLAVIGVVASVVGAYYYLRIVKVMFFDEPVEGFEAMPMELRVVLGLSSVFVIFFWLAPGQIVSAASSAAQSLF
jgi:NADH-quinone oxidoreductase subunit N